MKHLVLILTFLSLVSIVSGAIDSQYLELKKRSKNGNPEAQFYLGWMYDTGKGANRNIKKAFKWYGKAAEQGHAEAQFNLGWMYDIGNGDQQNIKNAVQWHGNEIEQISFNDQTYRGDISAKG